MAALEYIGHTLIPFDDGTYRWIDVKRFAWDGGGEDAAVLAALIAHPRYRDTFLSSDSHEQDAGHVHGPYWLAQITPASFAAVDPVGAAALVHEFCGLYDAPPGPKLSGRIEEAVLTRLGQSACYRLHDLPDSQHEAGWVLWEFRELAVIPLASGEVMSVVMAID